MPPVVNDRQQVNGPPATPPRYGLLVAAAVNTLPAGSRWQAKGVKWTAEQCGVSGRAAVGLCGSTDTLTAERSGVFANATPFLVWAADECGVFGFQARDWSGRAIRQLEATQSYQIANELWTGDLRDAEALDNPALIDSTSDTLTESGPLSVLDAFACLEQGLSSCAKGRRGMLHVTPQALVHLVAAFVVTREGSQYLSPLGNVVVADAGYDGSGPGGSPAGATQWMYATGMISVQIEAAPELVPGNLEDAQNFARALNRLDNTVSVRAQKLAMSLWDECCHLAAEVSLPICTTGGAS